MIASDNTVLFIGLNRPRKKKHLGGQVRQWDGRPATWSTPRNRVGKDKALQGPLEPMERLMEIICSDCIACGACAGEAATGRESGLRLPVKCQVKPCPGWADKTTEAG
jgi:hypothetical protein